MIVDGWLFRPGQPLFQVPAGTVITEVTPLAFRPDGYVEFRVRVGEKKHNMNDIDTTQHGTP